jgi:hypothetical protein
MANEYDRNVLMTELEEFFYILVGSHELGPCSQRITINSCSVDDGIWFLDGDCIKIIDVLIWLL